MAINTRVIVRPVGSGTIFDTSKPDEMVLIYAPAKDAKGDYIIDSSKGILMNRVGGVKTGSTGTIVGPSIRAPRKLFIEYGEYTSNPGGSDLIDCFPIQFDAYSGIGFVPSDAIRHK